MQSMPYCEVHLLIDMRLGEVVLRTSSIQVPEIHAYPDPTILLRHRNDVGQPRWVFGNPQAPCVYLLGDLFFNLEGPVRADPSEFLFNRSGLWVKRDSVLYNLRIDARHDFVGPRENIFEIF